MVTVIIALTSISFAFAGNNGMPFDELWEAIFGVQEDVEDIQSTLDLQGQIATLEYAVNELTAEVALLKMTPLLGPQGPPGPQGELGPEGPEGPPGEKGDTGDTGATGPKGDQGVQGVQGSTGMKGDTGEQGPPGLLYPDYDSGWTAITAGTFISFDPGFDIDDTFVYMVGRITYLSPQGDWTQYHQSAYGADSTYGAFWTTNADGTISVGRMPADTLWEEVRVMVWQLP